MAESRNMDAAMRIKEINTAREKIKAEPYLLGDKEIKESFEYGLCINLVLNDPEYQNILFELKELERIAKEKPTFKEGPNIPKNKLFFEKNKQIDGVFEVERGLQYTVLEYGEINSTSPNLSDTITAHFHGTLTDGTVFWSSVDSNEPLTITLSDLIEGCQKVISLMKRGDKWKVFIDPAMAYGEEGRPGIPPNSILVFDIKLLEID